MNKTYTIIIIIIAIIFIGLFIIFQPNDKKQNSNNQVSPLVSPSGNYILAVPIVEENKNGFTTWWQIQISDKNNKLLYIDTEGFPARFNVYWIWDENDMVWLYNSDDGNIYYWENKNNKWQKNLYDQNSDSIEVPSDLLPGYAK